jgi:hypothetical protein
MGAVFALRNISSVRLPVAEHTGVTSKLCQKQCTFGNQGISTRSEETKRGKVFGTLSQLKNLSKSNDVHAQDKTLLAVRKELLLPLKIRITFGGDIMFIH